MKPSTWIVLGLLFLGSSFLLVRWLIVLASPEPESLGVRDGRLAACPNTPNCVSTSEVGAEKRLRALPFSGALIDAQGRVLAALQTLPGVTLRRESEGYIHATVRSRILGFIDDVEFLFDDRAKQIHFRSASRLGLSDLGVNRRRMMQFSEAFQREIR